jgi:hypothetical protein
MHPTVTVRYGPASGHPRRRSRVGLQQRLSANDVESAKSSIALIPSDISMPCAPSVPIRILIEARHSGRHAHPRDVARSGEAPTGTGNYCTWLRPRLGSLLAWRTMAGVATTNAGASGRGTRAVEHGAKAPEGLRVYLYSALRPDSDGEREARYENWMAKNCLTLGELDRERIAEIDRRLALKLDGSPLAANTANRIRIIARSSVQAAIEAGAIAADAWPQRSKSRGRRKVARIKRSVDVRSLPSPKTMAAAIDAIVTQ